MKLTLNRRRTLTITLAMSAVSLWSTYISLPPPFPVLCVDFFSASCCTFCFSLPPALPLLVPINILKTMSSLQIKRVQYGSSGYRETPRGLTIENFLSHARVGDIEANRLPKVRQISQKGEHGKKKAEVCG